MIRPNGLTWDEVDCLLLTGEGLSNSVIAVRTSRSEADVNLLLRASYKKLGVGTRREAFRALLQHGAEPERDSRRALNRAFEPTPPADSDLFVLAKLLDRHRDPETALLVTRRLLDRFLTIRGVMGAPAEQLHLAISEIVASDAHRWSSTLALLKVAGLRVLRQQLRLRRPLSNSKALSNYLRHSLSQKGRERFWVLFLDTSNNLIADESMSRGTIDQAAAYPREVVARALEIRAKNLVLVHNHPGRSAAFSQADIELTANVCWAAAAMGMAVHDHVLISGDAVISMKQIEAMPNAAKDWTAAITSMAKRASAGTWEAWRNEKS